MIELSELRTALEAICAATGSEPAESIVGDELVFEILPDCLRTAVQALIRLGSHHLSAITGLNETNGTQVLYHFWAGAGFTLKLYVPEPPGTEARRCLPSLSDILPAASWYEREVHDLFGIAFRGHPHLAPLILPEDWDGPPPMLAQSGDSP